MGEASREMTLREWVEQLPPSHRARKAFEGLPMRLFTAIDQVVYARQYEWSKWGGLVIDRCALKRVLDSVVEETFAREVDRD